MGLKVWKCRDCGKIFDQSTRVGYSGFFLHCWDCCPKEKTAGGGEACLCPPTELEDHGPPDPNIRCEICGQNTFSSEQFLREHLQYSICGDIEKLISKQEQETEYIEPKITSMKEFIQNEFHKSLVKINEQMAKHQQAEKRAELRDLFAVATLPHLAERQAHLLRVDQEEIASEAYKIADAMLAERDKVYVLKGPPLGASEYPRTVTGSLNPQSNPETKIDQKGE